MDGVLTDTSGITTNKFYVYTDERNPRYSICCFRLGSQVKLSLPNELLNLFGGRKYLCCRSYYLFKIRNKTTYPKTTNII